MGTWSHPLASFFLHHVRLRKNAGISKSSVAKGLISRGFFGRALSAERRSWSVLSKPVAMTVTLISSFKSSSMTAPKNDVGLRVGRLGDDFGRLVHFEKPERRTARYVEQNALRTFDRSLQQRTCNRSLRRLDRPVVARKRARCP